MPNLKHAKKALRNQNKKKSKNRMWKKRVKDLTKQVSETPANSRKKTEEEFTKLQKVLDKAGSKGVIHKNKINRIKSSVHRRTRPASKG